MAPPKGYTKSFATEPKMHALTALQPETTRFAPGGTTDAMTGLPANMQELQIKRQRVQSVEVIELIGAVDALAFTEFSATLTRLIQEATPCVILECSHVTYIGSAHLQELIGFAHMAQARGGDLKCVGVPQTIQQVANLIAMGDLMEFYDDLPDALSSFRTSTVAAVQ
jgi:anti-anti-sigma factor